MKTTTLICKRLALAAAILVLASGSYLAAQEPSTLHATGQELAGTWLVDVRSPVAGQFLYLITFHADGTAVGTASDGISSAQYGAWTRSGDRQFLVTMMLFIFDSNRTLTNVVKGRINILLGDNLEKFTVTTERVVLDLNGNEVDVISGVRGTGRRVAIEKQKTPVAPDAVSDSMARLSR
jgi:hypothetical protein